MSPMSSTIRKILWVSLSRAATALVGMIEATVDPGVRNRLVVRLAEYDQRLAELRDMSLVSVEPSTDWDDPRR